MELSKPHRTATEAEESETKEFHDELKKKANGNGRHSGLHQSNQEIHPGRITWFSGGTWPNVGLSGQRDWAYLLGAITEDGGCFFSRFKETSSLRFEHFILTLYKEFEDDLTVVLDEVPYFQASTVTNLTACDDLVFGTLPAYSPELNPVEECWRQL